MGFLENVLRLRDVVSTDEGLDKLRRIFEKEDPREVSSALKIFGLEIIQLIVSSEL